MAVGSAAAADVEAAGMTFVSSLASPVMGLMFSFFPPLTYGFVAPADLSEKFSTAVLASSYNVTCNSPA